MKNDISIFARFYFKINDLNGREKVSAAEAVDICKDLLIS